MTPSSSDRIHHDIVSLDDPRIADYRHIGDSRYLRERRLFVAEGRLVVKRLLSNRDWHTESVLLTETAYESLAPRLTHDPSAAPIFIVEQTAMNDLVGFNIHRGCLALASRPIDRELSSIDVAAMSRVVVLEGVNNPDNVGGIFRSAAAFGVDLVILGPHCGDPLYRKAVRTSMAATLEIPFVDAGPWPDALDRVRAAGFQIVALTPQLSAQPLSTLSAAASKIALVVGAEGDGLSASALEASDRRARIPMTGRVDSLNVTTAASIAMYHLFDGATRS